MLPGKHDQFDGPYMLLLKWYYFSSYTHKKKSSNWKFDFLVVSLV